MKFTTTILAGALVGLAAAAPQCTPKKNPVINYVSGFNLGHTKHTQDESNGKCKDAADWAKEFNDIKMWAAQNPNVPQAQFNAVKLFSTSDCDALARAVPEAVKAGIKIWVGVWNSPDKYDLEKQHLENAMKAWGTDWIAGINVGSESLYRKDIEPWRLAEQIWDVKGMVQIAYGASHIAIGTADTWTTWENGNDNRAVFEACDVIIMNGFPYWEDASVNDGLQKFQEAIEKSRTNAGRDKLFVIGETGWPTAGPDRGPAVASVDNLKTYWKSVGCWLLQQKNIPWFWFSGYDEPARESEVERNFGITSFNGAPKVNFNMREVCGL